MTSWALSPQHRTKLLALAREAISHFIRTAERLAPSSDGDAILAEKRGVFVSLHQGENLRGCVGITEPMLSLQDAVITSAYNAAFSDDRFEPLTQQELPKTEIEISCLTPAQPIDDIKKIVLGRHGILLEKGRAKGVFLPQVAPQEGWDLPTTLSHLAVKAGLPADGWKKDCAISVFEAIVLSEKDCA